MTIGEFKITDRDDAGQSDQYGTDDLEIVMRLLAGILTGVQPPTVLIKSEQGWEWFPETSSFWIRDSDASHKYRITTGNLTGNFDLNIPTIGADSNFVIDSITNDFLEKQQYEKQILLKPISTPSADAARGQIYPDLDNGNKLTYQFPDGTEVDLTAASGAAAPTNATYVTLSLNGTLSQERNLASGDGISIVDNGANNSVTPNIDIIDYVRKHIHFYEEFLGDPADNKSDFSVITSNGGHVDILGVAETGVFGAWQLFTGTAADGEAGIRLGDPASFCLGQGAVTFECLVRIPTLADVTNDFIFRIGFGDNAGGASTDSVLFLYDRSTSVNWVAQTKNNGVNTQNASTTAVGTGWVRLKIVINAAGTEARFYVNGTELSNSPHTTNIPTGSSRQLTVINSFIKEAGTSERYSNVDYIAFDIKLTTPR